MVCIVASQKEGPGFESNSHLMPCGSPCSCSLYMGTLQVLELPPAVQRYASYINQDGQHDFELDKQKIKNKKWVPLKMTPSKFPKPASPITCLTKTEMWR